MGFLSSLLWPIAEWVLMGVVKVLEAKYPGFQTAIALVQKVLGDVKTDPQEYIDHLKSF